MGLTRVRGPDLWGLQLYLFTPGEGDRGRGGTMIFPSEGRAEAEGKERVQEAETQVLGEGRRGAGYPRDAGMGNQDAIGSKDKGENTPIESLLDVLGITKRGRGRKKQRVSCTGDGSLSPHLIPARERTELGQ